MLLIWHNKKNGNNKKCKETHTILTSEEMEKKKCKQDHRITIYKKEHKFQTCHHHHHLCLYTEKAQVRVKLSQPAKMTPHTLPR